MLTLQKLLVSLCSMEYAAHMKLACVFALLQAGILNSTVPAADGSQRWKHWEFSGSFLALGAKHS